MKTLALIAALWSGLWLTPDQQGARLYRQQEFAAAAAVFHDPLWRGMAWYRAGDFDKAAQAFSLRDTAEALYDQGNARLMLGKYEAAITCYDQALKKRPDWTKALENRELARVRGQMIEQKGGDMGGQKIGADEIVFDSKAKNAGQDTEITGEGQADQQVQALWLRRVQTKPADFLKSKFAYQHAAGSSEQSQ